MTEYTPKMHRIRDAVANSDWMDVSRVDPETIAAGYRYFDEVMAAHDAEVRAEERERAALHAEEGYRMEERCDDIAKRIRSGEPAEISARAGVVAEEPDWEYGATGWDPAKVPSLRESLDGALDSQRYWIDVVGAPSRLMKRTPGRKPGPWVPVKQEGAGREGDA